MRSQDKPNPHGTKSIHSTRVGCFLEEWKRTANAPMNRRTKWIARAMFGFWLCILIILIAGCGGKERIITRTEFIEVEVPIKCQATLPDRPMYITDEVELNIAILHYVEQLELAIEVCK